MDHTPLQALAGRLIPASAEHKIPGADDPLIFADVEAVLAQNRGELSGLLGELARLGAARITEQSLEALLANLGAGHPEAFGLVGVAVIQAYYRDDRVMESLGIEARPPFPKGYAVEEGDFSLVEPVRARGAIWRAAG
jgi:hypothetical protein